MTQAELCVAAEKTARILKARDLKRIPGMDDVAVKLNSTPTYAEVGMVLELVEALQLAGYSITKVEKA